MTTPQTTRRPRAIPASGPLAVGTHPARDRFARLTRLTRLTRLRPAAVSMLAPVLALLALTAPACAATNAGTEASSALTADAVPSLRLPGDVTPASYDVHLVLDPKREDFSGRITIRLRIGRATDVLWINASRLELAAPRIVLDAASSGELAGSVVPGNDDFVGLAFPQGLPAGDASLSLDFSGRYERAGVSGIFKQVLDGEPYLFTQFEPLDARKAFPCFDEPALKARWRISLAIPQDMKAFSNMPAEATRPALQGVQEVAYTLSPPLSSYLVAFAVGPFDVVDGGVAGRDRVPLRYIVPKGRAAEAARAVRVTPAIVDALEAYFDRPFPFPKLDSIAIPDSGAFFGAMENAGLIAYRSSLLLSRPQEPDRTGEQRYLSVAAHEVAHMWFGDLVTMAWWDDVWLNESFATWMSDRVVSQLHPEWNWTLRRAGDRAHAIDADRLPGASAMRRHIVRREEVRSAFDGIVYEKGHAVLAMFEQWLGDDAFRAGVRSYLAAYEWRNATADDFFGALAGADAEKLAAMRSFVDRPGVALLDVALDCNPAPALWLSQRRFLPSGTAADEGSRWTFPACFSLVEDAGAREVCTVMRDAQQTLPVSSGACPRAVLPNPVGGYFVSRLDGDLRARLVAAPLASAAEAVPLLSDVAVLADSGAIPLDDALAIAGRYAAHPDATVVLTALRVASHVRPEFYAGSNRAFAAWVRAHFGVRARALGWRPAAHESADAARLRIEVVPFVADRGEDRTLANQAIATALRWGKTMHTVPREMRTSLLETAVRTAGPRGSLLFDVLDGLTASTRDPSDRDDLYTALGSFREPAQKRRALDLMLDETRSLRETGEVLRAALDEPAGRGAALEWLDGHFDGLSQRAPRETVGFWSLWANGICDAEEKRRFTAIFGPRTLVFDGGEAAYSRALATIDMCLSYRDAARAQMVSMLAAPRLGRSR